MRFARTSKPSHALAALVVGGGVAFAAAGAGAQQAAYVGEIKFVSFDFCPSGWAEANGQILPVADYPALAELLGTKYGGDGTTTFGLPNLTNAVSAGDGAEAAAPEEVEQQPVTRQRVRVQAFPQQPIRVQPVDQTTPARRPTPAGGTPETEQGPGDEDGQGTEIGTPALACIALGGELPLQPAATDTTTTAPDPAE